MSVVPIPHDGEPSVSPRGTAFTVDTLEGRVVPPRVWQFPGLIPGRTVTSISGDGGMGKSTLLLQGACATVAGLPWIGLPPRRGNAIYLGAEDDADELHRRLAAIATFYAEPLSSFAGFKVWPIVDDDAVLAQLGRGDQVVPTDFWSEFSSTVAAWEPRLVVIDAAADVFAIDENNRGQVRQAVGLLRRLALVNDAAVVLLSHPSLSGLSSGSGSSGSTAWNNSVRSRLYLSRPREDDGGGSAPNLRILAVKKSNYGPSGAEFRLRLEGGAFVAEDALEAGGQMDRAIADMRIDRQFLELLDSFTAAGRRVGESTGKAYAPALFALDPRAQGTTSRGFGAAMARLFAGGEIVVHEEGPPSKRRQFIARADAVASSAP